jgi:hypothetical protein
MAQRLNFTQLFAALQELIERFKFQRDDPFNSEGAGAESAKVYTRRRPEAASARTDGIILGIAGANVFPGRNARRSERRRVLDDWVAALPREKGELYQVVVQRWECSYAMMSVALDDALALRACGELVCARQQVSIAAGLMERLAPSLISLCATLSLRGRHVAKFPAVEPMNAEFFRGDTGRSAASWNGILHHVLFSARSRFFHKLRILSQTLEHLEGEFEEAAGDIAKGLSVHPGDCWKRLDNIHYDFNTCLRESEVVLKSFLRMLPEEQLPALATELDAPASPRRVRAKPRLSGASASA